MQILNALGNDNAIRLSEDARIVLSTIEALKVIKTLSCQLSSESNDYLELFTDRKEIVSFIVLRDCTSGSLSTSFTDNCSHINDEEDEDCCCHDDEDDDDCDEECYSSCDGCGGADDCDCDTCCYGYEDKDNYPNSRRLKCLRCCDFGCLDCTVDKTKVMNAFNRANFMKNDKTS